MAPKDTVRKWNRRSARQAGFQERGFQFSMVRWVEADNSFLSFYFFFQEQEQEVCLEISGAVWYLCHLLSHFIFAMQCGLFVGIPPRFLEPIWPVICALAITGNLAIFPRKVYHSIEWPKQVLNSASAEFQGLCRHRACRISKRQALTRTGIIDQL